MDDQKYNQISIHDTTKESILTSPANAKQNLSIWSAQILLHEASDNENQSWWAGDNKKYFLTHIWSLFMRWQSDYGKK